MEITNKLKEKKAMIEVIEKLLEVLDTESDNVSKDYTIIGKEDIQAKDWRTDELLWEDEEKTIPKYRDKYGYVAKEHLTEDEQIKLEAITKVIVDLSKLI